MKKRDNFASLLIRSTDTIKELVFLYLFIVVLCSVGFAWFESIAFTDALWMSFVTATTTGYGDFFPKTDGGRIIGVFLMHSVVFVVAPLLVYRFIDAIDNNDFTHAEQERMKQQLDWLVAKREAESGEKFTETDV